MGAWNAIKGRLYEAHGDRFEIRRVSRADEGSPATGSHAIHAQEQDMILAAAFAPARREAARRLPLTPRAPVRPESPTAAPARRARVRA